MKNKKNEDIIVGLLLVIATAGVYFMQPLLIAATYLSFAILIITGPIYTKK